LDSRGNPSYAIAENEGKRESEIRKRVLWTCKGTPEGLFPTTRRGFPIVISVCPQTGIFWGRRVDPKDQQRAEGQITSSGQYRGLTKRRPSCLGGFCIRLINFRAAEKQKEESSSKSMVDAKNGIGMADKVGSWERKARGGEYQSRSRGIKLGKEGWGQGKAGFTEGLPSQGSPKKARARDLFIWRPRERQSQWAGRSEGGAPPAGDATRQQAHLGNIRGHHQGETVAACAYRGRERQVAGTNVHRTGAGKKGRLVFAPTEAAETGPPVENENLKIRGGGATRLAGCRG